MPIAYGQVLRIPGAAAFFATTAFGRLGVSMYGLSVILAGVEGYGSYVRAGLVGGTFAASEAIGGPLVGRLIDRRGQRVALPVVAVLHLLAMVALIIALARSAHPVVAMPAAALAGLTVPQLGALAAARWSHLLHGDRRIEAALSLESLANDVAFIVGPLAASTAVVALSSTGGLATACTLVVVASVLLVLQPRTMPPVNNHDGEPRGSLLSVSRVRTLVLTMGLVNVILGLLFGTTQLAVTALASADDALGLAGVYYLTLSVGSLVSSAGYGMITWSAPIWRRLTVCGLLVATGGTVAALAPHPVLDFTALFAVGLGVGPAIIITGTLIERHVGSGLLTQSFALMSALSAAGIALSGLVGGIAVQTHGHMGGFALLLVYGLSLCLIGAAVRRLDVREPAPTSTR
ncbi:MFS transporter [Actinoplanes sp. G11-F43]|uniref:MFS transporter n=1 Tax=Actinoplanes sp. G11-F43 TaxID=3424130 RepID=UPI003D34BBE6